MVPMTKYHSESVLECHPYGDGFAIWRVFLPKMGGFTSTWLKATGKTRQEAWENFERTITGTCFREAKARLLVNVASWRQPTNPHHRRALWKRINEDADALREIRRIHQPFASETF